MAFALELARVLVVSAFRDAFGHLAALHSLNEVHIRVAFALFRLDAERLAHGLEDVPAAQFAPIRVVVDRDGGVTEDAKALLLLAVTREKHVVCRGVTRLLKAVLYAGDYLRDGRELVHVLVYFVSACRQILHFFFAIFEEIGEVAEIMLGHITVFLSL